MEYHIPKGQPRGINFCLLVELLLTITNSWVKSRYENITVDRRTRVSHSTETGGRWKSYFRGLQDSGFPEAFGIWANIMYNYILCFCRRLCIHQNVNIGICIYLILLKFVYLYYTLTAVLNYTVCNKKHYFQKINSERSVLFMQIFYMWKAKWNRAPPTKNPVPPFPIPLLALTSKNFDFCPNTSLTSFYFKLILLYRAIFVIVSEV